MSDYFDPETAVHLDSDQLRLSEPDVQYRVMRHWFLQNYEDPAERTPYDSQEGGYIWIWGGPYYAADALNDQFQGVVKQKVIDSLAHSLTMQTGMWAPTEREGDYDVEEESWRDESSVYFRSFQASIVELGVLLSAPVPPNSSAFLHRVLFVQLITLLETYLADAFIGAVSTSDALLQRFVESTPEFKAIKMTVADVFKVHSAIERRVRTHLHEVMWHRLPIVALMYKATLGIEWPVDHESLAGFIRVRHDIVHRNGRDHEGNPVSVDRTTVEKLSLEVHSLVSALDAEVVRVMNEIRSQFE